MTGPEATASLGGLRASELAERFGTPLHVLDGERILENVRRLRVAFEHPSVEVYYACKANPCLRVLELLRAAGCGADACSPGEVHLAMRAGFPPSAISFTGTALTIEEARELARLGITVHVDALSQLERAIDLFPGRRLGIRINPGQGMGMHEHCTTGGRESKLGIPIEQADEALAIARRGGGAISRLHVHAGSGGLQADDFIRQARTMFELAERFLPDLESIDLGGGIGVPHRSGDTPFDVERYGREVVALLERFQRRHGRPVAVAIEPGQYLVSDAGWLLMRVVVRKENPDRKFLITDSSFNHYLGTALYDTHHEFWLADDPLAPATETVDICGHLCNTGDTFARDRAMPRVGEGDLLVMANAGDYGISRASTYNSRPIPAVVMVHDGTARLIRRRQTHEDLLALDV